MVLNATAVWRSIVEVKAKERMDTPPLRMATQSVTHWGCRLINRGTTVVKNKGKKQQ